MAVDQHQQAVTALQLPSSHAEQEPIAQIEKVPAELLVHIFCFVDTVARKRLERVCRLWKDVLRSPTSRSVVSVEIGPEWTRIFIATGEEPPDTPHYLLEKLRSEHTEKIVLFARIGKGLGLASDQRDESRHDVSSVWHLLDKEERIGKPDQKIILKSVAFELPSLMEAPIWKSRNSWSLEATDILLNTVSCDIGLGGTVHGDFGPGFSVTIDKLKLHFSAQEGRDKMEEKIWAVIETNSAVSSEEEELLEKWWGKVAQKATQGILRLREPLFKDGTKDLADILWKTLKPSTLRESAACIRFELEYGGDDYDGYGIEDNYESGQWEALGYEPDSG